MSSNTPNPHSGEQTRTARPATGAWFTLPYREAFGQWWDAVSPAAAEAKVLSFLPFNQPGPATDVNHPHSIKTSPNDPHGQRKATSSMVQLSGKDRILNEFNITRVGEEVKEDIVMLHGYGAGLGFFYKNYDGLSSLPNWRLWALDLLGYGRSSRPPYIIHSKDPVQKVREAEDWFIDALEEWRIKRGLDQFTLMGHSLGGYLAVCYALKYPGHLKKLILASPAGIPEDPYAVNNTEALKSDPPSDSAPQTFQDQDTPTTPPPRRPLPKWLTYLWDANFSPFNFVRWSGPLGPRFVSGWTSRRFGNLPKEEAEALHTYAYSLFRQRGSGEYALPYILAPGAFARDPLVRRIHKLGTLGVPTVLMYGDMDWMDVAGGYASEHAIRSTRIEDPTMQKWATDVKGEAKVLVVRNSGHHLYVDNWREFNEMVRGEMRDVERRSERFFKMGLRAGGQ
ncbi:putative alpha/beta hydrolase [Ascobolus immersus RN42]|uniref:Putative alpha/beta hydrolase n=1 Tax=Ascobolus immersus RN42 TaxID=1160509 RepID=A0A3N4ITS1_ASCIM|nr:putative alpha/beta hydrolase [Ascobolus immersus RN42]